MANETKAPEPAPTVPADNGLTLTEGTDPVADKPAKGVTVPVVSEHAKGLKLTTY